MQVNWDELAAELLNPDIASQPNSDFNYNIALSQILGTDFFIETTEYVLKGNLNDNWYAHMLAHSVVTELKPVIVIRHCYDIFMGKSSYSPHPCDKDRKYNAFSLLRDIFDHRISIPGDSDAQTEENLWEFQPDIYDRCEISQLPEILESSLDHPNYFIREQAKLLLTEDEEAHDRARQYLAKWRPSFKGY
jgi:hypothetical protein